MASIEFDKVCVDFPVYNVQSRSLKTCLIQAATGGKLGSDSTGRVVVRGLENLSFTLKDGDRVGILGHNGAGKSTLLRLIGGVYEPSSGTARITGAVGSLIDISLGIDPEASGRENIYFRAGLLGLRKAEISQHIDDVIEFSELGDFIDMPLRTYSTGMHMRLAFAVSTIIRPEILLLDEWLSVGDEKFKHKAEARMSALVEATSILVIASHSRELLLNTCNRAIWLEHGRVRLDGGSQEVCVAYFA
jgi:lipopolysaccharide transport system ATP-binding protein